MQPAHNEAIQAWQNARNLLDETIQQYLQSVTNLGSIPSDAIEAFSGTGATGDGISREINDCIHAAPSKIQVLETVTTKLSLIRNQSPSLVPIMKLPPEILVHIFDLCARNLRSRCRSKLARKYHYNLPYLIGLSRVCSNWRALVVNKPSFWTHLTFGPDGGSRVAGLSWNLLQRSIERASGNLLCLTVPGDELTPRQDDTRFAFECLRPFVENVTNLYIPSCRKYRDFMPWFLSNINTSSIQSISLTALDRANIGTFRSVDELYPQLSDPKYESCLLSVRSLYLQNASFDWRSPIYWNLISLTLDSVSMGRRAQPTVNDILSIISSSPELHTLRLCTTIFPSNDELALPAQVQLRALENLDLRRAGTMALKQLLPRLTISSKRLSVNFEVGAHPDDSCRAAMREFLTRFKPTRLLLQSLSHVSRPRDSIEAQGAASALQDTCSMAPYMTSLTLVGNMSLNLLKAMTRPGPTDEHEPCCPMLQSLHMINWELSQEDIETLADSHSRLKRVSFYGCKLPAHPGFDEWLGRKFKRAKVRSMDPNLELYAIGRDYADPTWE